MFAPDKILAGIAEAANSFIRTEAELNNRFAMQRKQATEKRDQAIGAAEQNRDKSKRDLLTEIKACQKQGEEYDQKRRTAADRAKSIFDSCQQSLHTDEFKSTYQAAIAQSVQMKELYKRLQEELAEEQSTRMVIIESAYAQASSDAQAEYDKSTTQTDKDEGVQKDGNVTRFQNALDERVPPKMIDEIHASIADGLASFQGYQCPSSFPQFLQYGSLAYDLSREMANPVAYQAINNRYHAYMHQTELEVPFCVNTASNHLSVCINYDNSSRKSVIAGIRALVTQILMNFCPGKAVFTFVDPVGLGETFATFASLGDIDDRIISGKIWTAEKDIEKRLSLLREHLENVITRCLRGDSFEDITQYNSVSKLTEPYQFLIIMDFPAAMNENSMKLLQSIVTNGERSGVYTIICNNENQKDVVDQRIASYYENICAQMRNIDYTGSGFVMRGKALFDRKIGFRFLDCPSNESLASVLPVIENGLKQKDRISIQLNDIMANVDNPELWFMQDTARGLSIPIGLWGANRALYLELGVEDQRGRHDVLVAGNTGSGKSVLLHTIITASLMSYLPEELLLYIIDFKRGVEFKQYANYYLPQLRVVAIQSDKEFGLSVLQEIDREITRRRDAFAKLDVGNIQEYRAKTGKAFPRLMLVFDEFDDLLSGDGDIPAKSAILIDNIITQGRGFGVHAILASQSIEMATAMSRTTIDEVAVRIALKCNENAAAFILGSGNNAINQLSEGEAGQAIFNDDSGNSKGNVIFRSAFIPREQQEVLLQQISERMKQKYQQNGVLPCKTRVLLFNIQDNLYHPLNVYMRGGEYASVDYPFADGLMIGEASKLSERLSIKLRPTKRGNLLMAGADTDKARSILIFSILSIVCQYISSHQSKPNAPIITLLDFFSNNSFISDEEDLLEYLCNALPEYISRHTPDDTETTVENVHHMLTDRQSKADDADEHFFIMFGLDNAQALSNQDFYSGSNVPSACFNQIVQNGPALKIHTIAWCEKYASFTYHFCKDGANLLDEFSLRIAFNMSVEDYRSFVNEMEGEKIGMENAVLYQLHRPNQHFRPYQMPEKGWLESIVKRINQ